MKFKSYLFAFLFSIGISHCAIGPTHGLLFTSNSFAGEYNTNNDVEYKKEATGCQKMILGIVSFGDAQAGSVAKANNITRIASIDYSTMSIFTYLYSDFCVIVSGE
ncbi:MAG: TRL-like family protein [Leptospiraceae bacterium]|nr:TRL-like family protein [Leptospiraceae bacterium]MCP5501099.1 TRL-like family protein [Leptospiraceae bacterium]